MSRFPLLATSFAVLALAAPGAALAADPIPGATYEGTTDTGSPFSFKVSPDGSAVTDILTSAALTCVGPEGGVEIFALASTVPFPVSGGAFSGKDESTTPRLDEVKGTFTSATEATGTIQAATSKFKLGEGVTSCMREVTFTARTTAAPPSDAKTTTPGPSVTAPVVAGAPALDVTSPTRARLKGALRKGLPIAGTVTDAARITATARISAKDARRYKVGRTLARGATQAAPGAFSLTLKPSGRSARRLRKARRLKVVVTLASDTIATTTRTITLTR